MKLIHTLYIFLFLFTACLYKKSKKEIKLQKLTYTDTIFYETIRAFEKVNVYNNSLSLKYKFFYNSSDSELIYFRTPIIDKFKDSLEDYNSFDSYLIDSLFGKNLKAEYKKINKNIDTSYFKEFAFFPFDTLIKYTGINDKHRPRNVYYLSAPILSKDKKYLFIELDENCNGGLCGYGDSFIFEKKEGSWYLLKIINRWIS